MPVVEATLQLDQGTAPTWSLCWVGGYQGVNLAGTTPTVVFRQVPTDAPLVTMTNVPNANGSVITYAAPLVNVPVWVPSIDAEVTMTLYPVVFSMTVADMALLVFPFMRAKFNVLWPVSGISIDVVHWEVEVDSV